MPGKGEGGDFDSFAADYVSIHQQNIAISGEDSTYFADYKLGCLQRLAGEGFRQPVLDYGCGIGILTERLARRFSPVHGYDPSSESLKQARSRAPSAVFHDKQEAIPQAHFGLAVMANVLHHVEPDQRQALVGQVARKLLPGSGRLVVFEHNPFNPLTRLVVSRCQFDEGVQLLRPSELGRLLERNGFSNRRLSYIVFFPRPLALFRPAEPYLGWLPLGAQVMAVGTAAADR
jgi:SAM-dependent methyltransferase